MFRINSKLKVGDKIRVRKDLRCGITYAWENGGRGLYTCMTMEDFRGTLVTISRIIRAENNNIEYNIEEDHGSYYWTFEMFESPTQQEIYSPTHNTRAFAGMRLIARTHILPGNELTKVIRSGNVVICFFGNYVMGGTTKVVAKCDPDDEFDLSKGLMVCYLKFNIKMSNKMLKKF